MARGFGRRTRGQSSSTANVTNRRQLPTRTKFIRTIELRGHVNDERHAQNQNVFIRSDGGAMVLAFGLRLRTHPVQGGRISVHVTTQVSAHYLSMIRPITTSISHVQHSTPNETSERNGERARCKGSVACARETTNFQCSYCTTESCDLFGHVALSLHFRRSLFTYLNYL